MSEEKENIEIIFEDETDEAFKLLKKALKGEDELKIVFAKFQFWLAIREIPIRCAGNFSFIEREEGFLSFKNIMKCSYIHIDERRLDQDYKRFSNFTYKRGRYAE